MRVPTSNEMLSRFDFYIRWALSFWSHEVRTLVTIYGKSTSNMELDIDKSG